MNKIDYFKLQAKNLYRDFKTQERDADGNYIYSPKFFSDIDELILCYDINEERFTLMNAQHLIAELAGFKKWSELIHASDAALELGELLLNNRNQDHLLLIQEWDSYLARSGLYDWEDGAKLELFKRIFGDRVQKVR